MKYVHLFVLGFFSAITIAVRILLLPVSFIGFVIGLAGEALCAGAEAAEDIFNRIGRNQP